ncbi:MAG: hypothetical protein OEY05_10865 [Paracoccaceae bacterium]|nr:hypothetical protein [Paracoccaceae bacterium]
MFSSFLLIVADGTFIRATVVGRPDSCALMGRVFAVADAES